MDVGNLFFCLVNGVCVADVNPTLTGGRTGA